MTYLLSPNPAPGERRTFRVTQTIGTLTFKDGAGNAITGGTISNALDTYSFVWLNGVWTLF